MSQTERPDLPGEQWRPVVGYEGRYEVSDLGRVWSVPRVHRPGLQGQRNIGGVIRVPTQNEKGYWRVWISNSYVPTVHRLVGEAFLGPLPAGLQTRHLDGDSSNNRLSNLKYGTVSENKMDQVRHGTHTFARRTHCPAGHEYNEANTRHRKSGGRDCRVCDRERKR